MIRKWYFYKFKPLVCVKTVSNLEFNLFWIIDRFAWIFINQCVLATNVLYNTAFDDFYATLNS